MRTRTYGLAALLAVATGCTEEMYGPDGLHELDEVEEKQSGETANGNGNSSSSDTTGTTACAAPKVLICHIPPGNPANAHAICVGASAVAPHVANHGDTIGACNAPRVVPPPVCQEYGADCSVDGDCCSMACAWGECIDRV